MQKKVTLEGKEFLIRGLKRGEVKLLKSEGVNIFAVDEVSGDEVMNQVFRILGLDQDPEFDELFYSSTLGLFQEILRLTVMLPEELKN